MPEAPRGRGAGLWLKGILPLLLLGALLAVLLRVGPLGVFRAAFPPVEELTIDRITFPEEGLVRIHVVNGGPEPVAIRQVMVDDAYWSFEIAGGDEVARLESTVIDVPYPWVDGEPLGITLLSRTGVTFHAEVPVATRSPTPDARYLTTFALIGMYVGVIPVFLGLLWLPFLRGIPRRWLDAILAFTLGLLVFLGVDALAEAVELAGAVSSAFQGIGLITLGFVGTPLVIEALGKRRRPDPRLASSSVRPEGFRLAFLVALGIGLHNLGEGLAIGAAYTAGEVALGTGLVVGFLLHNTTEGVGIVAPVARTTVSLAGLVLLGAVAGLPTVLGTWIGAFSHAPALTVLFLAVGAGAIVQVVWTLGKLLGVDGTEREGVAAGLSAPLNAFGLLAGLCVMYLTGLLVPA